MRPLNESQVDVEFGRNNTGAIKVTCEDPVSTDLL